MKNFVFSILIIINIMGAAIFLYDKEAAKWSTWRVRNWVMAFFAWVAALGTYTVMLLTKHKTTKFKKIIKYSKYIALIQLIFLSGTIFIK